MNYLLLGVELVTKTNHDKNPSNTDQSIASEQGIRISEKPGEKNNVTPIIELISCVFALNDLYRHGYYFFLMKPPDNID
jgi:hypothetical protein